MEDCIFCKIAKHEAPANIEAESELVIAFKSIDPAAEHHFLIIPKTHITNFMDLEKSHQEIFIDMAKVAQEIIDKKGIQDGYKLVFNGGKYQSVNHIHWHLLGGKMNDSRHT